MNRKQLAKYTCSLLLFGLNGIVASHIAMSSYEIVLLRTSIGGALLLVLFLVAGGKFHIRQNRRDALFVTLSGVAMGASWMFLYEAYQQVGVSLASLLFYCAPVIVMALSPLIFRERLTAPKLAGFAVVVVGLVLVNGGASGQPSTWGIFCGAMSAITYAALIILNKQAKSIGGMENSVIQLLASFLTVAVFVCARQGLQLDVPADAWPWVLVLGLVNTGLGCYLYFSAMGQLPVQTVATLSYLEPLSAVCFAALLLGESMTALQVFGAACIIGGAMFGELRGAIRGAREGDNAQASSITVEDSDTAS